MNARVASLLVATYLVACIALGGSTQNPWSNLGLQLVGIALIAWAFVNGRSLARDRLARALGALIVFGLLVVLVQLIPLPRQLWAGLPGREHIVSGQAALGYAPQPFTISQTPWLSVLTLFAVIPPLAAFIATVRLGPSPRALALAILFGMVASVFVGALQVAGGPTSRWHFYEIHSSGAIGFFANGNHMATLLLASIPLLAALVVSPGLKLRNLDVGRYALGVAAFVLVVVGIVLNGSRAAIALALPVAFVSVSLFTQAARWRGAALSLSAVALVSGGIYLLSDPITFAELKSDTVSSVSRGNIWTVTANGVKENFPAGTGLGSFEGVYRGYEDSDKINLSYVNHAHNDYLELVLELGAGGALLIIMFLVWWAVTAGRIWLDAYSTPLARAATIATGAILVHSIVDFPLRTAAISAVFAACIGLMTPQGRAQAKPAAGDYRATRHHTLG